MAVPILKPINIATAIFAVALIALSIATLAVTSKAIDHDFSPRQYTWYRGLYSDRSHPLSGNLSFSYTNENLVFASAGAALLAGLAALTSFFIKDSKLSIGLTTFFPLVAFTLALASNIATAIHHVRVATSTCYWENGVFGLDLDCTRELYVCSVLGRTTEAGKGSLADNDGICGELKRARMMLIPLTVVSAVVAGLGVARWVVAKRVGESEYETAEERVERLQRE